MVLSIRDVKSNYLEYSEIIDYDNDLIIKVSKKLKSEAKNNIDLIRNAFQYVRDQIGHSADIGGNIVTCKASEILLNKEGICFAKSHLLAALLRFNKIPCGFCYQKLILDDVSKPYLILHGLNAFYVDEYKQWFRIDARGNKPDVNAQFNLDREQLAFSIRESFNEEDILIVYSKPDEAIIRNLNIYASVEELFDNLPKDLFNR